MANRAPGVDPTPDARNAGTKFFHAVLVIAGIELAIVAGVCVIFRLTSVAEVSIAVLVCGGACVTLAVLPFLVPRGSIMPMGDYRMSADYARIGETDEVRSLARKDALDLRRDRGKSLAILAASRLVILLGPVLGLLAW